MAQSEALVGAPLSMDIPIPILDFDRQDHRYYIDGSWKEIDNFSGCGWIYHQEAVEDEVLLGARNARRTLSPLHSELEVLI